MIDRVRDAAAPLPGLQECPCDTDRAHSIQVIRIREHPGLQGPGGGTRSVPVSADGVDDAGDAVLGVVDGPEVCLRHLRPGFFVRNARLLLEGARYVVEEGGRDEDSHIRTFVGADRFTEAYNPCGVVKPMRT